MLCIWKKPRKDFLQIVNNSINLNLIILIEWKNLSCLWKIRYHDFYTVDNLYLA